MISTKFESQEEIIKQFDAIINSSYDGLCIVGREGKVVLFNQIS